MVLCRLSSDEMRPATSWRAICFTRRPRIKTFKNTFPETSRIMFDRIWGHRGPSKLMCKMNRPKVLL